MSIKMEPELRDQFMIVAATLHTPAAHLVRQLIRKFISSREIPNANTIAAMQEADRGEGTRFKSANDLFDDLDI